MRKYFQHMLLLSYIDHRNLSRLLLSKTDETCTYWKDHVFPAQKKYEPALILTLRVGFPRVTGVFKFKLFIAQLKDNCGTKKK